eukprot:10838111-Lingulodinium_polyedra.AAC.1
MHALQPTPLQPARPLVGRAKGVARQQRRHAHVAVHDRERRACRVGPTARVVALAHVQPQREALPVQPVLRDLVDHVHGRVLAALL